MYAAVNHIVGPQNKCGNLKHYIIIPVWKKIKKCFSEKDEIKQDLEQSKKEAQIIPQNSSAN